MNLVVDQPILNSPFKEPTRYWLYENGLPRVMTGRRSAGFYLKARTRAEEAQLSLLTDEQFVELTLINEIRQRVSQWRKDQYPGVTPITKQLLSHWPREDRERRLFFCQREAVETIIWLTECRPDRRQGVRVPDDSPQDEESISKGYRVLPRYGCKMATGSGKTVVMSMLVAWSVLNKVHNLQDRRFSDAILVVCPNLTVKERLQVLYPSHPENYYEKFDIVPRNLFGFLGKGSILVTNWHAFAPEDDTRKRGIIKRGLENDSSFSHRVLKLLGNKKNLLVFNDEAHHAYRPAAYEGAEGEEGISAEDRRQLKQTKEEATVWVSGLDRINATRGVNICVDLSATPFYIQGSGYEPGSPFPWLVSDFGLVDAIESGIVKIPRMPVADDTGQPMPKYFQLWKSINEALPTKDRGTGQRKPNPAGVLREAEGALQQLAGEWKKTFDDFSRNQHRVPPCMIMVCDNTDIASLLFEFIAEQGKVFPQYLQNSPGQEHSLRIDSRLMEQAELSEGETRQNAAEALRQKVATVGKEGKPGEQIRCVVSVGMLTEGWDAQNVTQILGLRAFQSQLLCEQVVGRGLRRINYDDFEVEEYVDVYGIPFEVIPVKKKPTGPTPPQKESTLVQSLPNRKEEFGIEFPCVEGFIFQVSDRIKADANRIERISVEPRKEPTESVVRARIGYQTGSPSVEGPGDPIRQTRAEFYSSIREQQIQYEITRRITQALVGEREKFRYRARHLLFPQILNVVRIYLDRRIDYKGADRREVGLEKYIQQIVERISTHIQPDDNQGESPLLPRIERFRPRGSTSQIFFRTIKKCRNTLKSHISHVTLDSTWEGSAAYHIEESSLVQAYAKNDHLGFSIPYDFMGERHDYVPDFLIRLRSKKMIVLEIKGEETEQDRAKHETARRWVSAVNNWGQLGHWDFDVCYDPQTLGAQLQRFEN
jgi:type III restriction enzyme